MKLLSPAKINLFLHVTGRRPDGYHDLFTLMCCVSLCDDVLLSFGGKGIRVRCTHKDVPADHTNLAHRAAVLFLNRLEQSGPALCRKPATSFGLSIAINKRIPVGAGLGGGSSNAAAVLIGLNRYFGFPFNELDLRAMGLQIGSDIPFLIRQKPALAQGIGDRLTFVEHLASYPVILVFPGFGISTAQTYKNLNLGLTSAENNFKGVPFCNRDFDILRYLHNDLETVSQAQYPEISEMKSVLKALGAQGTLMTGSGSTTFGVFTDTSQARAALRVLRKYSYWTSFLTRMWV